MELNNHLIDEVLKANIEAVKILIEKGANINCLNKDGYNSLMLALKKGHIEIVKLLIEKGININYVNKDVIIV